MSNEIPFGLRHGRLYHVDEVARGDACGCICPECKAPIRANHGTQKNHYFSHQPGAECQSALETSLHLAAKQILEEYKELCLPCLKVEVSKAAADGVTYNKSKVIISSRQLITVDSVEIERGINDMRPDIIVSYKGHKLLVEVAVTHFVDDYKKDKIKGLGISCVELDFSKLNRRSNWKDIRQAISSGLSTGWVVNTVAERTRKSLSKMLDAEIHEINVELRRRENEQLLRRKRNSLMQSSIQHHSYADLEHHANDALESYCDFRSKNIQRSIRCQLELKSKQHPLWKYIAVKFDVADIDEVPKHLITEISHDLMFQCDPRIWQILVFLRFVHGPGVSEGLYDVFAVKDVADWLKSIDIVPYAFYRTLKALD